MTKEMQRRIVKSLEGAADLGRYLYITVAIVIFFFLWSWLGYLSLFAVLAVIYVSGVIFGYGYIKSYLRELLKPPVVVRRPAQKSQLTKKGGTQ